MHKYNITKIKVFILYRTKKNKYFKKIVRYCFFFSGEKNLKYKNYYKRQIYV